MTLCTKAKKKSKRKYSSVLLYARQLLVQELRVFREGNREESKQSKVCHPTSFFPHKKKGGNIQTEPN